MDPNLVRALAPILLFWFVEANHGLTAALALAAVWATGDLAWTRWQGRPIDRLTLGSTALVIALGGLTAAGADERIALITPILGDLVIALALAIPLWRGRSPLVELLASQRPEEPAPSPSERRLLDRLTGEFAALMTGHAALTAATIAWWRDGWSFVTGPGQLLLLGALVARAAWWPPPLDESPEPPN